MPPATAPSSSTATPMPDGDEIAASSAWRRSPPGRNSEPPAAVPRRRRCRCGTALDAGDVDPAPRDARLRDHQHPFAGRAAGRRPRPASSSGWSCSGTSSAVRKRQPAVAAVASDEVGDEIGGRGGEQVLRRVVLLQHAAAAEHRDPVAEFDRLVDVVGDEHDRLVQFGLQPLHLGLQVVADHGIDGAERLVHQQDRRIGRQRPGDTDALLLPAGQLRRVAGAPATGRGRPVRAPPTRPCGRRGVNRRAAPARSRRCRPPCGAAAVRRSG